MDQLIDFKNPIEIQNSDIISLNKESNLEDIFNFVKAHNVNTNNSLFLNQLFGNTDDLSVLADKYIAENNTSMYTYEMASVFNIMELEITKKLQELIGFKNCNSFFLPGGSLSNIEAINTARYYYDKNIKKQGNRKDLIILTSDQAHYSIEKGCALLGLGSDNLIKIQTNDKGQILIDKLEKTIEILFKKDKSPFMIVGTAGTTVLGAFDNLDELIRIKEKYNLWLHIDGALGGSLIFNKDYKDIYLKNLHKVDSFCFNPHKLLNLNLQSCVLLFNQETVTTNYTQVDYLFNSDKFYDSTYDTGNKYFMCGRKPDIFKFWLVWKMKGVKHFSNLIENIFKKALYFKKLLISEPNYFKIINNDLSPNVCFFVKDKNPILIKENLFRKGLAMITYQKTKEYSNFFRICFANSNCEINDINNLFILLKETI
jgi:glutamate/tyrosine decarboxylase-like PLP-dependent enzyme